MNQAQSHQQVETGGNMLLFVVIIIVIFLLVFIIIKFYSPLSLLPNKNESPFVSRENTKLLLMNQPFYATGVNDYSLAYKDNISIDQTFKQLQTTGVTTIRFWLFDDGNPDGFQPTAGNYNESRFRQADYVLYEAKKYNIKVIPVLVNNWNDYGGKTQYLKWIGKDPISQETAFYTDIQIKKLFEKYIDHVLTRKNTYTKILYTDDPAILGWDIMNEPRSSNQDVMNNWLISIAEYIKQHDRNHLVFAGTENAIVPQPKRPEDEGKTSNLCANPAIDICSLHLYLFSDTNQPLYKNYHEVISFIQMQKNYADSVNKPLLMEEMGIEQNTQPFGESPLSVMKQLINYSDQSSNAGVLIWDWSDTSTTPLTFSPYGNSQGMYSLQDLKKILHQHL